MNSLLRKLRIFIVLIIIIAVSRLYCQDSISTQVVPNQKIQNIFAKELFAIHPKMGIIGNFYLSNFNKFQGAVDCGTFTGGSGIGTTGILFLEKKYNTNFQMGLGLAYIVRSGAFTLESGFESRDSINLNPIWVKTENRLEVNIPYFEIQPEIRYILLPDFIKGPLRAMGAFRFSFPIEKTFIQSEKIISPDDAAFTINGKKTKNREIAKGIIESINSFNFGISLGIENLLKTGTNSYFSQQLVFDYNLIGVCSDVSWNTFAVRLELGFRYGILSNDEITPPSPPPMPNLPKPEEPKIVKKPKIIEKLKPELKIEIIENDITFVTGSEILASVPLVNAVFFGKESSTISQDYTLNQKDMPDFFTDNPIDAHKYILPRIAEIIKKNPDSKIILQGATSGTDYEAEGISLAQKRTETIKEAFVTLGVDTSKIVTNSTLMPEFPSNQEFKEGIEENQRVDIIVENAPLQEFVEIQRYAELKGNLKFIIEGNNLPEPDSIIVKPSYKDTVIICEPSSTYTLPVNTRINNITNQIDIGLTAHSGTFSVNAGLTISKLDNTESHVEFSLDNFEAILRFDYNSSKLSEMNQALLKQMSEKLPEGSTIMIYGSSDALGTERRNAQLAEKRAQNTKDYIKSVSGKKFKLKTSTKIDKYPEETPQGRFINRSIRVKNFE